MQHLIAAFHVQIRCFNGIAASVGRAAVPIEFCIYSQLYFDEVAGCELLFHELLHCKVRSRLHRIYTSSLLNTATLISNVYDGSTCSRTYVLVAFFTIAFLVPAEQLFKLW